MEKIFKKFLKRRPDIDPNNIINYSVLNEYDILIKYKNGMKVLYDTFNNSERNIPYTKNNLSTAQYRLEFRLSLNKIMQRKNITESELANKIGTSQSMVSRYLTGKAIPGFVMLDKIAKALNCSCDDFYFNDLA